MIMSQSQIRPEHRRESWSALIAAAGRGTRLGYEKPKILYPVAGRAMLDWLLDLLRPWCSRIVLVVSPDGLDQVSDHLALERADDVAFAVQPRPTGMADAVAQGLDFIETRFAAIVWGDQVALSPSTVGRAITRHEARPGAVLTFPAVWRQAPYIHFERAADGRLSRVLQRREGDCMPAEGEGDAGLFIVTVEPVITALRDPANAGMLLGRTTGEKNFLPLFPILDCGEGAVETIYGLPTVESIGVNTAEEARDLAPVLLARR